VTDATIPVYRSVITPAVPGEYVFVNVPRDDYIIIGVANGVTDYKHLWSPVSAEDLNWGNGEIFKNLILMTDNRGKKSPGKTKKVTGSELIIVEPEYVEWTSEQELYPFAFESIGDWNVAVSVAPPEGFVADQESLSEEIPSALKAIQFTITDVGSSWKPTEVKARLRSLRARSTSSSQGNWPRRRACPFGETRMRRRNQRKGKGEENSLRRLSVL
jgi:hypothetical protein